jgi:acyl carrier protein
MTFEEFVAQLRVLLRVDIPDPVDPSASLYDELGLDSFQAFELLIVVEALAGNVVPPATPAELFTLADAFAYYEDLAADDLAGR